MKQLRTPPGGGGGGDIAVAANRLLATVEELLESRTALIELVRPQADGELELEQYAEVMEEFSAWCGQRQVSLRGTLMRMATVLMNGPHDVSHVRLGNAVHAVTDAATRLTGTEGES